MKWPCYTYILLCLSSCHKHIVPKENEDNSTKNLIAQQDLWRTERINALTAPQGWLSLIGLYWLKEGSNTIGSLKRNKVEVPPHFGIELGNVELNGDSVSFTPNEGLEIYSNGSLFGGGQLLSDATKDPTILNYKSLYWYIIKRGESYGVRIKDTLAESRLNFQGIENFPFDKNWIIKAKVKQNYDDDSVKIVNVIGAESMNHVEVYLQFSKDGHAYNLVTLDDSPDYYFLIISDETTGFLTYGGGRFINIPRPKNGEDFVMIDFNRAFNPPCVFSNFATCPLPPLQNHLFFEVLAGEKKMNH